MKDNTPGCTSPKYLKIKDKDYVLYKRKTEMY